MIVVVLVDMNTVDVTAMGGNQSNIHKSPFASFKLSCRVRRNFPPSSRATMVTRKSRSRKTADNMASYKDHMSKNSGQVANENTPRKSPRSKMSKIQSDTCTRLSGQTSCTRGRYFRKDPSDNSVSHKGDGVGMAQRNLESAVEIPRTPPPEMPVKHSGDGVGMRPMNLERALEIPETPPLKMQVAGRTRALAPQSFRFGTHGSQNDTEDSQKPSKKRKVFNTPPRGVREIFCDKIQSEDVAGSEKDSSLLPPTSYGAMPEGEEILDILFDQDAGSVPGSTNESGQTRDGWAFGRARNGNAFGVLKPSIRHDSDLEIISVSKQALTRHFDSFKKKVVEEMHGLHRLQKSDLREMSESIINPLLSEVRDIRDMLEMLSNGSSSGKSGCKTSLAEWEGKLNELTRKAEVVFSKAVFARILCFNAPFKVCEVYKNCMQSDAGKASAAVQTLLFSHLPSSKKDDFSEGIGKLLSEFKYAVVQNTFYNVCKEDTFDLFRSPLAGDGPTCRIGTGTTSSGERRRINCPDWLRSNYVTVDHINEARSFMESLNQSRKSKIRETPSLDDIASHGALRVYRQLGGHLHKGRDYMRSSFFQGLGYLFVPWKDYVSDNDQRKMILKFSVEDEASRVDVGLNLDDIPCTELCSFVADAEKSNQVEACNRNLLKQMFSEWTDMVLHVEHDVHVSRGGGAQRKRSAGERRRLYRFINLIEVACNVVVEYTRVGSIDLFLRGHKHALRCIMVLELLIKKLTMEFISARGAMEPDPVDLEKSVPDPLDIIVHGTSLKVFLPGKSVQESYLSSRCLRISEKVYDSWNVEKDPVDGDCVTRAGEVFVATEITENDKLGIAAI